MKWCNNSQYSPHSTSQLTNWEWPHLHRPQWLSPHNHGQNWWWFTDDLQDRTHDVAPGGGSGMFDHPGGVSQTVGPSPQQLLLPSGQAAQWMMNRQCPLLPRTGKKRVPSFPLPKRDPFWLVHREEAHPDEGWACNWGYPSSVRGKEGWRSRRHLWPAL